MFPTPGPGMHGGPPRTGLVMWQPQPGMRCVKMNLQGEQASVERETPHGVGTLRYHGQQRLCPGGHQVGHPEGPG